MNKYEYRLKNYLNIHQIYGGSNDMQTIIINSFFNQKGGDNNQDWKNKCKYCTDHFGLFAQYANNEWKINSEKFISILKNKYNATEINWDTNTVEVVENKFIDQKSFKPMNYTLRVVIGGKKHEFVVMSENDYPNILSQLSIV